MTMRSVSDIKRSHVNSGSLVLIEYEDADQEDGGGGDGDQSHHKVKVTSISMLGG